MDFDAEANFSGMMERAEDRVDLSVVMPCLNEKDTVGLCVQKALDAFARYGLRGEVIVADNGSTDGSQQMAAGLGARVIPVATRGYGSALREGIAAARGEFILMGDADDTYDFTHMDRFVAKLREGFDLVMGNRFQGGILPGAMPPLHRYLGNPVLSGIGRLFFKSPVGDFHCGLRAFRKDAIGSLGLRTLGMEFASEMVVKATLRGLCIAEVPTTLSPDGRSRPPHLRSWRDGWRHLRFLLLFSPSWLFLYPGAVVFVLGALAMAWLLPHARQVAGVTLDIHTLFYAALAVVVGVQSMQFWMFAKLYGMREGIVPPDARFTRLMRAVTLETGLIAGAALLLGGLALGIVALSAWGAAAFGNISPEATMRLVIPSGTAILLAFQIAYGAFFLSVLEIRSSRPNAGHAADLANG
jgi:glycosyltransferase involved in cell wall biosynthesis